MKMRAAVVSLALLLSTATLGQQKAEPKAVEITSEHHHHLFLKNAYTRVFKVEVAPHESTLLHHHAYDYLYVTLGPAFIENDVQGKPPVEAHQQDGEVHFTKGGFSHVAVNKADTPFRNVTIEILKPEKPAAKAASKPERGLDIGHGVVEDTVLDNDRVRAVDIQLAPGAMLPPHQHATPHLLVAVTDLALHRQTKGKPDEMVNEKAGGVVWVPAGGSRSVMNMGKAQARFISVEFK